MDQNIFEVPLKTEPSAPAAVKVLSSSVVLMFLYTEAIYSPINVPK